MPMSEEDRALLADAPAAVFVVVAGADGTVDDKERGRFAEILAASSNSNEGVLGEVLSLAEQRSVSSLDALSTETAEKLLQRGAEVARTVLSTEDWAAFKRGLLFIAERVASASGGGALSLGKRTAQEERAAIDRIQALLG